jgi:hypothetical protein
VHEIDSGEHEFFVQYSGNSPKGDAERITINIESGKSYYILLIQKEGAFTNNIYCQEVTENSAATILSSLK